MKLGRDVYHFLPYGTDPNSYSPDGKLVAKCVMKGKDYYIGYSSAMDILGIIRQPGLRTTIVTKRQVTPSVKAIAGMEIQFICHTSSRFFGYEELWLNLQEKAMVSDLEKTIVDAVTKPHLCGGIVSVGKAIFRSHARTNQNKLFYYLARNRSKAAKKRFLFLSEFLGLLWTNNHERMLRECGTGTSLLEPCGPVQGKISSRFGLKINVELSDLKDYTSASRLKRDVDQK